MTQYERAQQLWSILALAAKNRQVLTYDIIRQATGLVRPSIGQMLSPVQDYCLKKKLPPLTILVVSEKSGLPGVGFIAAQDIPKTQHEVFAFDWLDWGCPTADKFAATHEEKKPNQTPEPTAPSGRGSS